MKQKITLLISLFLLITNACSTIVSDRRTPALHNEGEIFIYLQPLGQKTTKLKFKIDEIAVLLDDGSTLSLALSTQELQGASLIHDQKLLAAGRLTTGDYKGILITITAASLLTEDGWLTLLVPPEPLLITKKFQVVRKKAQTFFLTLNSSEALEEQIRFRPVFSIKQGHQDVLHNIGYASRPRSNTITVFNKTNMQITGIIATGSMPKSVVIDASSQQAYIALAEDDAIGVIDILQNEEIGRIPLEAGDQPEEIALSQDGNWLVSANSGSNTASIIDPVSRTELERIKVGESPFSVTIDPNGIKAYVMNKLSNTVSVIDLERRALATSISLTESPLKAAFNREGSKLYVITENSHEMIVIDSATNTILEKIFTGPGALSILVDKGSDLVYVGKNNGEIAIVQQGLSMFIDTMTLAGKINSMTLDDEENALFVVTPDRHALEKVNLVSKKVMGSIDLEETGYAVAVIGAR